MRWILVCIFVTLGLSPLLAADEDSPDSVPRDAPHDRGFYHQRQEQLHNKDLKPETDGVSPSVAQECPDKHMPAPLVDTDNGTKKIDGPHSKACP
jgi:hypothetical protein